MAQDIQLLQFLICERFQVLRRDGYLVEGLRSNLHVPSFPHQLKNLFAVTCWRKDDRFHKEVIEYEAEGQEPLRSPHMDIEPVRDPILFRWHTHRFPAALTVQKPGILWVRVILDWKVQFESYLLIEKST